MTFPIRPPTDRCPRRWYLPAAFVLISGLGVSAQQYLEIEADLEFSAAREADTNAPAEAKPNVVFVKCITGGGQWEIEHNWVQNSISTWLFDGTNVYRTSRITRPMPEATREVIERTSRLALAPFEVARSNLTINVWPSGDGHPMGDLAVNITWLAFCSGGYLKREGRLVPLLLEELRHTRDRFAYTDKTETFADELGLPRAVDLFLSRTLFLRSETEFDQEYFFKDRYTEWVRKAAEKLPEGMRMFHYVVTESTNVVGWTIPTKFEFEQEGRKFEQNGDWHWRGTGRVKSIRPGQMPKGVFDPSMQQTIVDRRFWNRDEEVDAIIYTTTNAFLAPTNDPALQDKFARRAAELGEMRKKQGAARR